MHKGAIVSGLLLGLAAAGSLVAYKLGFKKSKSTEQIAQNGSCCGGNNNDDLSVTDQAKIDALKLSLSECKDDGSYSSQYLIPPRRGEVVLTSFGFGVIESYQPEDQLYTVLLAWQMAENNGKPARVRAHLHIDSVFKLAASDIEALLKNPNADVQPVAASVLFQNLVPNGTEVCTDTNFKNGVVHHFDVENGTYHIRLSGWELDHGALPFLCVHPESVARWAGAKCDLGAKVNTSYGVGEVLAIRHTDGSYIVRIAQEAGGAIAYLRDECILATNLIALPGDTMETAEGQGQVVNVKFEENKSIYQVRVGDKLVDVSSA